MDRPTQDLHAVELRRMLAEAWRDLAGDHEGMVWLEPVCGPGDRETLERRLTELGEAMTVAERQADGDLPDVDHPGNWGVWLTWALAQGWSVEVDEAPREEDRPLRFAVTLASHYTHEHHTVGGALLGALVQHREEYRQEAPSAVFAWWKAEQEADRG